MPKKKTAEETVEPTEEPQTTEPETPEAPAEETETIPAQTVEPSTEPKKDYDTRPGKWKGQFWIWADGRATHTRHIFEGILKHMQLPPGFYKATEKEAKRNPAMNVYLAKAREFELEELS